MFTFLELQSHVIFENIEYQKATETNQTHVRMTRGYGPMDKASDYESGDSRFDPW